MKSVKEISIEDFDYQLPDDRIAYFPAEERDHSKLLVYRNQNIEDYYFYQLPELMAPGTMMVFNDSKVIHARLLVYNSTGAAIEIFCLEPLLPTNELSLAFTVTREVCWKCFVGNAKRWKTPITFVVDIDGKSLDVKAEKGIQREGAFEVRFTWDDDSVSFATWIEHYGKMPLPPYIKRIAEKEDENRYQTVYAEHPGSVAAPTAGLHFSDEVLHTLKEKDVDIQYVTLHVGAGTFKPVTTNTIGEHYMHEEQFLIQKNFVYKLLNQQPNPIIAVGTTVARTLESLFIVGAKLFLQKPSPFKIEQWEIYEDTDLRNVSLNDALNSVISFLEDNNLEMMSAVTQLIIVPEYQHKVTDGIITNFHQPKSTLLLIIASYIGNEWKRVYQHALNSQYRFLSFGDSNYYQLSKLK